MKTGTGWTLGAVLVALAGTGGYVVGTRGHADVSRVDSAAPNTGDLAAQPAKKLLYYRNPMGLPDTSPTPKKTRWAWTTSRSMKARPKKKPQHLARW